MFEVDVSSSISGSTVTSVDVGIPPGSYPADGTQTDPHTYTPYEPGTPLINDENGVPVPATTNEIPIPVININTTQTYAVREQPLVRESLIFDRPTKFGRFRQAIDWVPVDRIHEQWGVIQIIIAGKDVTYFRDHPAEMGSWTTNEPNGDTATSIFFPQISWWERPNHGDLWWIQAGKPVTIFLVRPNGTKKTLFEGLFVSQSHSGKGLGITLDILGCLYQADHTPYIQELYSKTRDIGTAIADIMDGAVSRQYGKCNRPNTGIMTKIRGSGGARLTQGVQDLLSTAFTAEGTDQWTITNMPGRMPFIKLKDKTTRHWIMAMGHPGLDLQLTNDFQQSVGMIWGSGVGPDGDTWFNAKYPGTRIETAPPFPLAAGQKFVAGDSHTGFDEFADELRSRGYTMHSGDKYSTQDVDEVKNIQLRAGIPVDGIVGAQTWVTVMGVGGSLASLANAHISPLAVIPENRQYLERADGSIIKANPKYDKTRLAIGRLVEYGEVSKQQATRYAVSEVGPRSRFDPMWVGSATIEQDPENGSRWEMRAGENLYVKYMYPPLNRFGIDDGLLLHMSQVSVTPGGSVSAQLSYLGHDMTTLAAIRNRNKDTLDPARRKMTARASQISQDRKIPWDKEGGGGRIPAHALQAGRWVTFAIPAGQNGTINEVRYVCGDTISSRTVDAAFDADGVLPGAHKFCVAIFSKPVTANFLDAIVGNPLTNENVWSNKAVTLERAGLLQAYGSSEQPAGYWPGKASEGAPLTGKMLDGSSWPWRSVSPPYLFIAEYCASSTRIAGQLRDAPFGS